LLTIVHSAVIRDQLPYQQPSTMHSFKPVSFCFQLFLISAAILVAVAVPTNHTPDESRADLCTTIPSSQLDMRLLQDTGYCHYKVHEHKFGNRTGQTRNPDVIYRIVCEETADCKQVYLTVEVALYNGSTLHRKENETLPAGCLYSTGELRCPIPVESMEPSSVS
jgi:hypothetical protein